MHSAMAFGFSHQETSNQCLVDRTRGPSTNSQISREAFDGSGATWYCKTTRVSVVICHMGKPSDVTGHVSGLFRKTKHLVVQLLFFDVRTNDPSRLMQCLTLRFFDLCHEKRADIGVFGDIVWSRSNNTLVNSLVPPRLSAWTE